MKNFHILGVHRKIQVLQGGEGVHKKMLYRGDCLKREALTICRFIGGSWPERERWYF